jgi:hypothetical protein
MFQTLMPPARAGGAALQLGGEQLVQTAAFDGAERLSEAPEQLVAYEYLWEGHHAGAPGELHASSDVLGEVDFGELQAARLQQTLHACAERARLGRINDYLPGITHYFIKCSSTSRIRWAKALPPALILDSLAGWRAS